jgi:hypothetical protein
MVILENTRDRLVVAERPSLTGLVLAVLLAVLIWAGASISPYGMQGLAAILPGVIGGGILIYVFARSSRLTLDRRADTLVLRQTSVLGLRKRALPLGALVGATLQRSRGARQGHTVRMALVLREPTGHRDIPMTPIYTGGPGPDRVAEAINTWLAASQA